MDLVGHSWTLIVGGDGAIRGYVAGENRIVSGVRMDDREVEVVPASQLEGAAAAFEKLSADVALIITVTEDEWTKRALRTALEGGGMMGLQESNWVCPPSGMSRGLLEREVLDLRGIRDCYWQALVDIAGLENWQNKAAGDIAREALGLEAGEVGR